MNIKKLLVSLVVIGTVGFAGIQGVRSFFSDTETSTGNLFKAGTIDLKIGNQSYYNGQPSSLTSWALNDLTIERFFNFNDVKPGDWGEDTIEVQVGSNPAYMCANVQITENSENGVTEPEEDLGDTEPDGELAQELNFVFWKDDGDNVLEQGEDQDIIVQGPASAVLDGGTIALADSDENNIGGTPGEGVSADQSFYIGKAWCFGDMTLAALPASEYTGPNVDNNNSGGTVTPEDGGVTCNGVNATNITQSDRLVGDISFYAVQTRNNSSFQCSDELFPGAQARVGAVLAAYNPPTCDVTVTDNATLANALTDNVNVPDGSTICLSDGVYNEFDVTRPLTIAGVTNPASGSAKVVPSGPGVTELALVTSSDVTITGLHFDGNGVVSTGNQMAGVQISPISSNIDNVNVVYNIIENLQVSSANAANKGIQWFTEGNTGLSLTNSLFANNVIDDISSANKGGYGIQTVGAMSNVTIDHNTISNITGAWGAGIAFDTKDTTLTPMASVLVTKNQVMSGVSNGTNRFAVQVEYRLNGAGISVNENNIQTLLHGGGNPVVGGESTVDAENNWWGDTSPADDVFGDVDYDPYAASAYPVN